MQVFGDGGWGRRKGRVVPPSKRRRGQQRLGGDGEHWGTGNHRSPYDGAGGNQHCKAMTKQPSSDWQPVCQLTVTSFGDWA